MYSDTCIVLIEHIYHTCTICSDDSIMRTLPTTVAYILLALLTCDLSSASYLDDSDRRTIYVNQENGSNDSRCWDDQEHTNVTCQTLDLALLGVQNLISANSSLKVVISSGAYHLGPYSNLSTFIETHDLSIVGKDGEKVVVNCNHSNGFAFVSSQRISFENILFNECQTNSKMPVELAGKNPNTVTGLAFYNSSDIILKNVTVRNSQGIATLFYNTMGENIIDGCSFLNNQINYTQPPSYVNIKADPRASGGLYILFFYCLTDSTNPNCITHIDPDPMTLYTISDCTFSLNDASQREFIEPRLSNASLIQFREVVSKGGGLSLLLHGYATRNSITVRRSTFERNSATWGGGVHVCYRDFSKYNHVRFENCNFDSNSSPNRLEPGGSHGGGVDAVFLQDDADDLQDNSIVFDSCNFTNNSALFGGGVSLQVSEIQGTGNNIHFTNTTFMGNQANVGAAADLSVSFLTSKFGQTTGHTLVTFEDCSFSKNIFKTDSTRLRHTTRIGNGVLYIYRVQARFKHTNTFFGNEGTSLVLATRAHLMRNSQLNFYNNSGIFGGALRFTGGSRLDISHGTSLEFVGNSADYLGGGIHAIYSDVHSEVYQSNCFLQYEDQNLDPDNWNATFTFINNTALNKRNSVWSSSLVPCYRSNYSSGAVREDVNSTFCWRNWKYIDSDCHSEVSSGGTRFEPKIATTPTIYPGIAHTVPLRVEDDFGNDVSSESILVAEVIDGDAKVGDRDSFFRADSNLTILGTPNTTITLSLQTLGPSGFIRHCHVNILPCPPGFVPLPFNITDTYLPANATPKCVCDDRSNYNGNVECDQNAVTATILNGFSMSYDTSSERVIVGAIPFVTQRGPTKLPLKVSKLEETLCGELDRTGLLCGHCKPGFSVVMGFNNLDCINCTMGLVQSWVIFCAEQLLPTTLFFLFIILGNINAASAPFNAFIFFSQVMTVPLRYRQVSSFTYSVGTPTFINGYIIALNILFTPYSIWNLDFKLLYTFHHNVCFVNGNNILSHLSMEYINAVYPLVLIGVSYILIELHSLNFKPVVLLWKPFRVCFLRFRRTWNPKLSIINAFATFIIVSYVEFITTSVKLLSCVDLYSGDSIVSRGHYFDASIDYFGPRHLPFAALAIIILSTFVLLPPLLMFLYPLKIVQKCIGKINCKFCNWQSLRIFVDVIQGSFKDGTNGTSDRRFFSGFYFVFRIVLIMIYGVLSTVSIQYLLSISTLIIAIVLFVILQPYKDDFYNKFDTVIFVIMLIIHFLDFFNFYLSKVTSGALFWIWAIGHVFFLMPLLYIILKGIVLVWKKCRGKKRRTRAFLKKNVTDSLESSTRKSRRRRSSFLASRKPSLVTISEVEISDELPDRLLNPESYEYKSLNDHVDTQNTASSQVDQDISRGNSHDKIKDGHSQPRLLCESSTWSYGALQSGDQDDSDNLLDSGSQEMKNMTSSS